MGITFIPAKMALAGLVPWADLGIKHSFLLDCPIDFKYLLIVNNPAYYPVAPLFGWNEISSNLVTLFNQFLSESITCVYPCAWSLGAKGWILSSGHVKATI